MHPISEKIDGFTHKACPAMGESELLSSKRLPFSVWVQVRHTQVTHPTVHSLPPFVISWQSNSWQEQKSSHSTHVLYTSSH